MIHLKSKKPPALAFIILPDLRVIFQQRNIPYLKDSKKISSGKEMVVVKARLYDTSHKNLEYCCYLFPTYNTVVFKSDSVKFPCGAYWGKLGKPPARLD